MGERPVAVTWVPFISIRVGLRRLKYPDLDELWNGFPPRLQDDALPNEMRQRLHTGARSYTHGAVMPSLIKLQVNYWNLN